jgi:hypothetical protein
VPIVTSQASHWRVVWVVVIVLGCIGGRNGGPGPAAPSSTEAVGSLVGQVTRGPVVPVEVTGSGGVSPPAPDVRIHIADVSHSGNQSVVTDRDGMYQIMLPAGTYRVEVAGLRGMEFTKDLPATVTITAGKQTRLDVHIDTGMR